MQLSAATGGAPSAFALALVTAGNVTHVMQLLTHRWSEVWRMLRELQAGAWASLPATEALAELCRALLRCGNWRLARSYLLHTASTPLPSDLAEQIVLAAGREYFHAANAHDAPEIAEVSCPVACCINMRCALVRPEATTWMHIRPDCCAIWWCNSVGVALHAWRDSIDNVYWEACHVLQLLQGGI